MRVMITKIHSMGSRRMDQWGIAMYGRGITDDTQTFLARRFGCKIAASIFMVWSFKSNFEDDRCTHRHPWLLVRCWTRKRKGGVGGTTGLGAHVTAS